MKLVVTIHNVALVWMELLMVAHFGSVFIKTTRKQFSVDTRELYPYGQGQCLPVHCCVFSTWRGACLIVNSINICQISE